MTTQTLNKDLFKSLIATVIREDSKSYIVNEVFERFFSVQELMQVTEEELLSIKGIGKIKAKQILAALQLARMSPVPSEANYTISDPQKAFDYLQDMQYLTQEHFVVIGLNTKNQVIFRKTVFIGSLNASIVHPREVFNLLIRHSCASCIVAHNHPSGNPEPSSEDLSVTKRLAEAGKIMGVDVLDHCIIGHGKYISLKEKGYL